MDEWVAAAEASPHAQSVDAFSLHKGSDRP